MGNRHWTVGNGKCFCVYAVRLHMRYARAHHAPTQRASQHHHGMWQPSNTRRTSGVQGPSLCIGCHHSQLPSQQALQLLRGQLWHLQGGAASQVRRLGGGSGRKAPGKHLEGQKALAALQAAP